MEHNQEKLEAIQTSDPLWISPDIESNISNTNLAEEHYGQEPPNMEEFFSNRGHIQEFFQSENSESNNNSDIESDMSDGEIYMSPVNLSSDTESNDGSNSSSSNMDSDTSDEVDVVVEDDQEDERHRRQMVDTITAWLKAVYQQKLEEEICIIQNCDKLDWTDTRFTASQLLCREEINETLQMLDEGSILFPLSKEDAEE